MPTLMTAAVRRRSGSILEARMTYFLSFLGFRVPLGGDMGGSRASASGFPSGMFGEDIFSSIRGRGGEGSGSIPWKGAAIERTLPCSLEDLYKGTTKTMKISRDIIDASG